MMVKHAMTKSVLADSQNFFYSNFKFIVKRTKQLNKSMITDALLNITYI